jgi:hypothetical protein
MKGKWVIDVCSTCGRKAQWPFCEHRPEIFTADTPPWCQPVHVTGTWHPEEQS